MAEQRVYGNEACFRPTLNLSIDATKSMPDSLKVPRIIALIKQQAKHITQLLMLSGPSFFMLRYLSKLIEM